MATSMLRTLMVVRVSYMTSYVCRVSTATAKAEELTQ